MFSLRLWILTLDLARCGSSVVVRSRGSTKLLGTQGEALTASVAQNHDIG